MQAKFSNMLCAYALHFVALIARNIAYCFVYVVQNFSSWELLSLTEYIFASNEMTAHRHVVWTSM